MLSLNRMMVSRVLAPALCGMAENLHRKDFQNVEYEEE